MNNITGFCLSGKYFGFLLFGMCENLIDEQKEVDFSSLAVLAVLEFVISKSEQLSDSIAFIIEFQTVLKKPWLSAEQNVVCPCKTFPVINVLYALTILSKVKFKNHAEEKQIPFCVSLYERDWKVVKNIDSNQSLP